MTGPIPPILYALACGVTLWLLLLWAAARLKSNRSGGRLKILFGLATVAALFAPIGGLPLWSWMFGFCPNPSLPMLGVVCAALWQHLGGVAPLKPADWRMTWIFGASAGTVLYLHAIIFPAVDLYYWGWDRATAVWSLAGLAIVLLGCGNRLGLLFLGALIAFQLDALESRNCWDYVVDPVFWIVSVVACSRAIIVRWWARRPLRSAASAAVDRGRDPIDESEHAAPARAGEAS
jgi:hypothetical protein